jgi:hypothetical protein
LFCFVDSGSGLEFKSFKIRKKRRARGKFN